MSLAPGSRLGAYEVLSLIGAGGMGEVYKARDTRLDRTVAAKVLPTHVAANPAPSRGFVASDQRRRRLVGGDAQVSVRP